MQLWSIFARSILRRPARGQSVWEVPGAHRPRTKHPTPPPVSLQPHETRHVILINTDSTQRNKGLAYSEDSEDGLPTRFVAAFIISRPDRRDHSPSNRIAPQMP